MITYSKWLKKLATRTLVEYQKEATPYPIFICSVLNEKERGRLPNDTTPWIPEYVERLRDTIEAKLILDHLYEYKYDGGQHAFKMPFTLEAKQNWLLEQSKMAKREEKEKK